MAGRKKNQQAEEPQELVGRIVGAVVTRPLSEVKPNTWNPNRMTDFQKRSIRHGFVTDGWIASQALLIWGTNERGKRMNIIIDGEHRYYGALDVGIKEGPMVFLDKLTEAQAKALTVKMDAKRGKFDDAPLSELLREVQFELGEEVNLSLALGIEEENLMGLLAEPAIDASGEAGPGTGVVGNLPSASLSQVKQVQLMFDAATYEEFTAMAKDLAVAYKMTNTTDLMMELVRRAHAAMNQNTQPVRRRGAHPAA